MRTPRLPIDYVVRERLKMPSVQENIRKSVGLYISKVEDLAKLKHKINSLKEETRQNLVFHLGGPVNLDRTELFLNKYIKTI